jgi:DNA-binding LytR/AlgR family response regulator
LLRGSLGENTAQEVTLAEELESARRYLAIEQYRFPDRLRVEVDAPEELLSAAAPNLILQPLVENAVRHGIARSSSAGVVRISAERRVTAERAELILRVEDDGDGFPPDWRPGVGLGNTRAPGPVVRRRRRIERCGERMERRQRVNAPALIFVTAYDQYALKAFEFSALDYLLKPFTDERFAQAVARAKTQLRQRRSSDLSLQMSQLRRLLDEYRRAGQPEAEPPLFLQRFPVRKAGVVHFVPADEVDWLEADGYCTKLHCGKQTYLVRGNLGGFEAQLDPRKFARIQRSAIVNLRRVQCLKNWFHGEDPLFFAGVWCGEQ